MEGPAGLILNRQTLCITIIILFNTVGLAGFYIQQWQPLFLNLVPWHLLLMLAVISFSHQKSDLKFACFAMLLILAGYIGEWVGIHKHIIFGNYAYGTVLGLKVAGVPLLVGVNWLLLTYATGVTMRYIVTAYAGLRIVAGALVMVALDLAIEPIAIKYNYWHWSQSNSLLTAPISNYIGWFLVSILMLALFEAFKFKRQSLAGPVLLLSQFVFFILLRWA